MELTINEKQDNGLLQRTEVKGTISFEGATPSNADVAAEVAKQLGVDTGLVVVKSIYTQFSHQQAEFTAVAYKTAEARGKAERMTKHIRKKIEEEQKKAAEEAKKKAEEAAAAKAEAEKAEEKPAEEAPAEAKEETKAEGEA